MTQRQYGYGSCKIVILKAEDGLRICGFTAKGGEDSVSSRLVMVSGDLSLVYNDCIFVWGERLVIGQRRPGSRSDFRNPTAAAPR